MVSLKVKDFLCSWTELFAMASSRMASWNRVASKPSAQAKSFVVSGKTEDSMATAKSFQRMVIVTKAK